MTDHPFHSAIGSLIKRDFPNSTTIHIYQDKACDPFEGQTIPLFNGFGIFKGPGAEFFVFGHRIIQVFLFFSDKIIG